MAKELKIEKPIKMKDGEVYTLEEGEIVYINIGDRQVVVDATGEDDGTFFLRVWDNRRVAEVEDLPDAPINMMEVSTYGKPG